MKKFILIFLLLFSFSANANEVFKQNKNDILKIENYLNSIKYFSSTFVQNDNISNAISEGKFYLSRPNKLRLEYKNPSEILLITNNKSTVYYDVELEEFTKLPTKKTPIHFLTQDRFDFQSKDLEIVNFESGNNETVLSLRETGKKEQNLLSLIFQNRPIKLKAIGIENELGQDIVVNFSNININSKIKDEQFVFVNPKSNEEIRKRY